MLDAADAAMAAQGMDVNDHSLDNMPAEDYTFGQGGELTEAEKAVVWQ